MLHNKGFPGDCTYHRYQILGTISHHRYQTLNEVPLLGNIGTIYIYHNIPRIYRLVPQHDVLQQSISQLKALLLF